ncbi:hypothetical protein B1H29_07045 [Streptomyces pactum]|uniref:Uncharacterized protein n=1 Tax=Streptomyces pactum TaxID=68249 RepID=A0A1S6J4M3_9ACTN|nr:hypothetical protein B1H29_07045 [Streptomyces pactum]
MGGCTEASAHRAAGSLPVPLNGAESTSAQQARLLHDGEERAIASCMRRRGFSYRPVPAAPAVSANPYGLLTEDTAGTDGYGLVSAALAGAPKDPNARHLAKLSTDRRSAWREALVGTDDQQVTLTARGAPSVRINTDGCVYLARRDVYGPGWEQGGLDVAGVSAEVVSAVTTDPEFLAAQRKWAACMRDRGERVGTLQQARGVIQQAVLEAEDARSALVRAGRREQRLARRDATCQSRSDLAEVTRTVQRRVQDGLPHSSRQRAAELKELRERALRRAGAS